ncbi:MAG TPA: SapC family protein [Steroidobacteraceae bacterium]|nr:SapC family protein [Steroidobacteraceae bacterium]
MSAAPESLPQFELLDPERHHRLRLRSKSDAAPHFVQIVANEFATAAACCPILFTKDAARGNFYAGAMFGFKPGESFIHELTARGGFNPLGLQREGFYISGEHIAIDRSNARFSETEGEPLFDDARQPNSCLRQIQRALGQLQAGIEATNVFIRALTDLKLIEPIDVELTFGGELLTLQGLYTVSLDAIRELDDAAALRLLRAGHLQLAYTMNASLKQISVLAQLRNRLVRRITSAT